MWNYIVCDFFWRFNVWFIYLEILAVLFVCLFMCIVVFSKLIFRYILFHGLVFIGQVFLWVFFFVLHLFIATEHVLRGVVLRK